MSDQDTPDFKKLMETAQKMQESMQKAHQELVDTEIVGESGGGEVTIIANGRHEAKEVKISDSAMQNKEVLEDLIAAAVNDCARKIEKLSQDKMRSLTDEVGMGGEE